MCLRLNNKFEALSESKNALSIVAATYITILMAQLAPGNHSQFPLFQPTTNTNSLNTSLHSNNSLLIEYHGCSIKPTFFLVCRETMGSESPPEGTRTKA